LRLIDDNSRRIGSGCSGVSIDVGVQLKVIMTL